MSAIWYGQWPTAMIEVSGWPSQRRSGRRVEHVFEEFERRAVARGHLTS